MICGQPPHRPDDQSAVRNEKKGCRALGRAPHRLPHGGRTPALDEKKCDRDADDVRQHGGRRHDVCEKVFVVELPDAVARVWAVMIEVKHAVVAHPAVRGPRRSVETASGTVVLLHGRVFDLQVLQHRAFLVKKRFVARKVEIRNDARVRVASSDPGHEHEAKGDAREDHKRNASTIRFELAVEGGEHQAGENAHGH
eukprot:Amastigsp_a1300_8.p2 type:complete len:197 gc:universal Amastigsp_a1300_8:298-888(+)